MSYKNFEEAINLAKECDYYTVVGGIQEVEILKCEALLNLKFSKQSSDFYRKLGYLSFYGNEFFGIDSEDLDVLEGNSVAYALYQRKRYGLSKSWLPIYNFNDGYMAYLDYSHCNEEGEPKVIMAIYTGKQYEINEVIAEDLGDFLLKKVQSQLANQQ